MGKPKQPGNNKPTSARPQPSPQPSPQPTLPAPSVDRRLIGTDQRSANSEITRKVIETPEKK